MTYLQILSCGEEIQRNSIVFAQNGSTIIFQRQVDGNSLIMREQLGKKQPFPYVNSENPG